MKARHRATKRRHGGGVPASTVETFSGTNTTFDLALLGEESRNDTRTTPMDINYLP